MDGIHVLRFILTAAEACAHPARDDRTADVEIDLTLLVRRLVAGERVSRIERLVFEQELTIPMNSIGPILSRARKKMQGIED